MIKDYFFDEMGKELKTEIDKQMLSQLENIKHPEKVNKKERFEVVVKKTIDHCYHSCPYFEIDGGPGPVMCCGHPYFDDKDYCDRYIISYPDCHDGFPEKCPLREV